MDPQQQRFTCTLYSPLYSFDTGLLAQFLKAHGSWTCAGSGHVNIHPLTTSQDTDNSIINPNPAIFGTSPEKLSRCLALFYLFVRFFSSGMCGRAVGENVGSVSWAVGFGFSRGFEAVSNHNKRGHYYYLHVT